ncbi:MAG: heme-binding protein [Methylacidiphilales bacterium]|nr:heme-binding protein [Candidatus Methylacidiphilales bacterium]
MINVLIALFVIIVLWTIWGYFGSRVEQADYSVVKKMDGYEIREYPVHIVAQTTVEGSYNESMSAGFRIVARYIFGGNNKKKSIAMTAPVVATMESKSQIISFGIPRSYTLETLPIPNDPRVNIVMIPAKKYAVIRFAGYRSEARVKTMQSTLFASLARDGVMPQGSAAYAGYNAPWTPPWMNRNEVMVEISN